MTEWTLISLWQRPLPGQIVSFGRWRKGEDGEGDYWQTETMLTYADSDFEVYKKLFERYFVLPVPPLPEEPEVKVDWCYHCAATEEAHKGALKDCPGLVGMHFLSSQALEKM